MTTDSLADRILQALTGEAAPTRADADALADALRAVLTKGTPQQVTDLLSRLVQAGVIVVQGDVNIAGDDALLVTHSNVQLAPGQDVILEALQTFRRRIAEDQALQSQVRVAEYLVALRDYCASLPYLSLHDIRPSKTLDEVYIPLKARPQPRKGGQDLTGLGDLSGLERSGPLSIAEVMRQRMPPHVLILGEPGAGKSTLLRQLAERAWDAPEKIGLDAPCLPILIPLRQLAALEGSLEDRLNHALTGELALTQDLPEGFFTHWPEQTGANWLLLLDALDEVPAEQRPRLMDWLKRTLKTVGHSRIVITSRPSGYSPGELDDKLFGHYDLLPFTPEQTGEFARKWFGDKGSAEHFLKELDRVRAGDLRGTPLLLTIAAKVYLEKGTLPERRSALYDQFVGIWLAEAEQRGLRVELGGPVCDVARFALARLALAMTEQPRQSAASLSQVAAAYLLDAVPLSADRAQVAGERFVRVMARRSGVFTCRGDVYDFIHPTFREYLAAWAVVRECRQDTKYDTDQIWQRVVSCWEKWNWREAALFALGILSDAGVSVTALVERILHTRSERDRYELFFAGEVLAEQVDIDKKLGDGIIDDLLTSARDYQGAYDFWRDTVVDDPYRPIYTLEDLMGYPRAVDGLLSLACNGESDGHRRMEAARSLNRARLADKAVQAWSTLSHDTKMSGICRAEAAEALGKLGWLDDAVSILLALVHDVGEGRDVHARALEALGNLGRANDLLALAYGELMEPWTRERAARLLGKLGQPDQAVRALLALARDDAVPVRVHGDAIESLGWFANTDVLPYLETIAKENKNAYIRWEAQRAIEQIRRRASKPEESRPFGAAEKSNK